MKNAEIINVLYIFFFLMFVLIEEERKWPCERISSTSATVGPFR